MESKLNFSISNLNKELHLTGRYYSEIGTFNKLFNIGIYIIFFFFFFNLKTKNIIDTYTKEYDNFSDDGNIIAEYRSCANLIHEIFDDIEYNEP